jgi:hypothetical protein
VIARGRGALALAVCVAGCGPRACDRGAGEPPRAVEGAGRDADGGVATGPRCVHERTRGALAVMQGVGPLRALAARCEGDLLSAWADRGGTLSRATRSTRDPSAWSLAVTLATDVRDLGVMDGQGGPVAWRAATTDDGGRAERWRALRDARDERAPGGLGWPETHTGRGLLAAVDGTHEAVRVLGSFASRESADASGGVRTVLARVGRSEGTGVEARGVDAGIFAHEIEGELQAYEPRGRVGALARSGADGLARIALFSLEGDAMRERGTVALATSHALVAPRGARAGGTSAFLVGGFDRTDPAAGGCLLVGEGACVRPGPLTLVRLDVDGVVRARELASAGLPDALAEDGEGWVALFVALDRGRPAQRVARVGRTGAVEGSWELRGEGLPPLDHPTLVSCAGEPWLLGEALVAPAEDGGERESGVLAVPLACLSP